jgi:hypothetical protein
VASCCQSRRSPIRPPDPINVTMPARMFNEWPTSLGACSSWRDSLRGLLGALPLRVQRQRNRKLSNCPCRACRLQDVLGFLSQRVYQLQDTSLVRFAAAERAGEQKAAHGANCGGAGASGVGWDGAAASPRLPGPCAGSDLAQDEPKLVIGDIAMRQLSLQGWPRSVPPATPRLGAGAPTYHNAQTTGVRAPDLCTRQASAFIGSL